MSMSSSGILYSWSRPLCNLKPIVHAIDTQCQQRVLHHNHAPQHGAAVCYVPLHPAVSGLVADYLDAAGHGDDDGGALFRPLHHSRAEDAAQAITPDGVYKIVRGYSAALGFEIGAHALRATAATNALDH